MENSNKPNSDNFEHEKISSEVVREEQKPKLEPKPKPEEEKKESVFMKSIKKVGYSVWLGVMIIGAGLAFIASILLL